VGGGDTLTNHFYHSLPSGLANSCRSSVHIISFSGSKLSSYSQSNSYFLTSSSPTHYLRTFGGNEQYLAPIDFPTVPFSLCTFIINLQIITIYLIPK
jgi:hypothetical protein